MIACVRGSQRTGAERSNPTTGRQLARSLSGFSTTHSIMVQSPTVKDAEPRPASDVATVAGRGAIYITLAKLWFMASGYGIAITLTYLLTTEEYGLYRVVINAVSIVNAVIVTGTYQ